MPKGVSCTGGGNELLDGLFSCPDQQHHGPPQFIPHTRDLQHFLGWLYLFHHLKCKAAVEQSHEDLREGVVLLDYFTTQKTSYPLTGPVIIIHRPILGGSILPVDPVLMNTGSKNRVLDVEQESAAGS